MLNKYEQFKNAVEIARELCEWGFTLDHLDMALEQEEWYQTKQKEEEYGSS